MINAKTFEEFATEIHSNRFQKQVKTFAELEALTLEWLNKNAILKSNKNVRAKH